MNKVKNHILLNDFYSLPAIPKWSFDVEFVFRVKTSDDSSNSSNSKKSVDSYKDLLSKSIIDIKFPGTRIEKLLTYMPGMQFAYPGKSSVNGELVLTFNDDDKLTIRRLTNYLMQMNYNPRYQQQDVLDSGTDGYESLYELGNSTEDLFDIYLKILDGNGRCVQQAVFKCCFVKSLGAVDLNYSSEDILKTTVTISYPYFKILEPGIVVSEDTDNI